MDCGIESTDREVTNMSDHMDIIYTKVDEAPELASGSLLPCN